MVPKVFGAVALAAWVALELLIRRPGEASKLTGSTADRLSTPLLVGSYAIALVTPIDLAPTGIAAVGDAAWLGVGLALFGLALRAWAMATLGAAYSRTLRMQTGQALVTSGPYRWVRHPGYAGSLAVWIGATLSFGSWLGALIVAVLMLAAYAWRIRREETMPWSSFGPAYEEYAARTSRLIPGLH